MTQLPSLAPAPPPGQTMQAGPGPTMHMGQQPGGSGPGQQQAGPTMAMPQHMGQFQVRMILMIIMMMLLTMMILMTATYR